MVTAAQLPPPGLPGLDPAWSRLVTAVDADGVQRTWHVLDNGPGLTSEPVGTLLCVHGNPTWSYLWRSLLALADAAVVPSIFPEAFGMVAAEAAAAGCPPIVANHSGLAEIAQGLERHYPPELRHLPHFPTGNADELRAKLDEQLSLGPEEQDALHAAAREASVQLWSWTSVARRILAVAS